MYSSPQPTKLIHLTSDFQTKTAATMAATRSILLLSSRPLGLGFSSFYSSSSSSSSSSSLKLNNLALPSSSTTIMRSLWEEKRWLSNKKQSSVVVVVKASSVAASETSVVTTSKPQQTNRVDMASLLAKVTVTALMVLRVVTKRRPWKLHSQMLIERVITDCQFFTLFAVVGSLVGSILCFVEGCFMVLESYFHCFNASSQSSDQVEVVHLLIEAIDMFLIGTAMLIFGMGLHVMFVGSKYLKGKGSQLPASNFFGLFYLKTLPRWVGMNSITQAKSKIGQAVMMTLQVGVLEKFKSIPLVTGFDLVCFAGAVFVSSACIFLLSRLSGGGTANNISESDR